MELIIIYLYMILNYNKKLYLEEIILYIFILLKNNIKNFFKSFKIILNKYILNISKYYINLIK